MKMKFTKRFKILWSFIKPFKLSFSNLFLCIVITSFMSMLYPYMFGLLVDEVFYHQNAKLFVFIVASYFIVYLTEQLLNSKLNKYIEYFNNVSYKWLDIKYEFIKYAIKGFDNLYIGNISKKINNIADYEEDLAYSLTKLLST